VEIGASRRRFSLAFCLALVPGPSVTKSLSSFQPLAPAQGNAGEFVPRLSVVVAHMLDDERYIGPLLWSLDASPINIDDFPDRAFDTEEERNA